MDHAVNSNTLDSQGIQDLSLEEVELTNGGIFPIVVAYYSIAIAGTALAAGSAFVAGAKLGYAANRE